MSTTWHPILEAREPEPGRWVLFDGLDRPYAEIRLVRRGAEVGYRAELRGQLVGYFTTLRTACEDAHLAFIHDHTPRGAPNGGAGYPGWDKSV